MVSLFHRTCGMMLIKLLCLSLLFAGVLAVMTEQDHQMHQRAQQIQKDLLHRDGKEWDLAGLFDANSLPEFHPEAYEQMMSEGVHPVTAGRNWNLNPFRTQPRPTAQYYFSVIHHNSPLGWQMGLVDDQFGNHATGMVLWKQTKSGHPVLLHVDLLRDQGFIWEKKLVPLDDVMKHVH